MLDIVSLSNIVISDWIRSGREVAYTSNFLLAVIGAVVRYVDSYNYCFVAKRFSHCPSLKILLEKISKKNVLTSMKVYTILFAWNLVWSLIYSKNRQSNTEKKSVFKNTAIII